MPKQHLLSAFIICLSLLSAKSSATDFEITPLIGQMSSSDLEQNTGNNSLSLSSGTNIGLGIAWQDTPTGQGQVLINFVNHDFTSDVNQEKQSLDILYTHFNGIAQFRQQNYLTTLSIGLGGVLQK